MRIKTVALVLFAIMLAGLGLHGMNKVERAQAGAIGVVSGFNPSKLLVGTTGTFFVTFFDDSGTSSLDATITGGSAIFTTASVTPTCAAPTLGLGTTTVTLADSQCDANATQQQLVWRLTLMCTAEDTIVVSVTAPGNGSLLPGATLATPTVDCVESTDEATNTIQIAKVDQFGQALKSSFSIQKGPFWVEVARVNLGNTPDQNPCTTSGEGGALCGEVGVVTPTPFANGLPKGVYRVIEVGGNNPFCRLVQVYNANRDPTAPPPDPLALSSGTPLLLRPATIVLPDANPDDLRLTFVNSCTVPGLPSQGTSAVAVVPGGSSPGLSNTVNIEMSPAPGSASAARIDVSVRDTAGIPIPNAHVTILIDNGSLAVRRDVHTFPAAGYEVIEPEDLGATDTGDTCSQATNGFLQQSTLTGNYQWPFLPASRQVQDGYTNTDGFLSACIYVDGTLAPSAHPGTINVQAVVQASHQGGLYPGSAYYILGQPANLATPNYLTAGNIVLTGSVTVVGPPASIVVAAAPTSVTCGEKATVTVQVKDSIGQNVSDHTRVELTTNFGGVLTGNVTTLGPVNAVGGQMHPISSSSAETFNGVAKAFLLTSSSHVGPYEVVAATGGSVMATNGSVPSDTLLYDPGSSEPNTTFYFPSYAQGLLSYAAALRSVVGQATVTCTTAGASAPANVTLASLPFPGTLLPGVIKPPSTGDGGLR